MRYTHHPAKCPECQSKTDIEYGNGYGKDTIICHECGWQRVLPISTKLSLDDKIGIIAHRIISSNARNK